MNISQLGGCFPDERQVLADLQLTCPLLWRGTFCFNRVFDNPVGINLGGTSVSASYLLTFVSRKYSLGLRVWALRCAWATGYLPAFGLGVYSEVTLSSPATAASTGDRGCTNALDVWLDDLFHVCLPATTGVIGAAISPSTCNWFLGGGSGLMQP